MIGKLFEPFIAKVLGGLSIALLLACAGLWLRGNHYLGQRDRARTELVLMHAANREATAKQLAANLAQEARYRAQAEESDHAYRNALGSAQRASADYTRTHRLPAYCSGSGPVTPAPDLSAGVPEAAPASSELVAVTERDVTICGDLYTYSKAAFDWASGLNPTKSGTD